VKGTIINKFRGDLEILKPGLTMLEDIIDKPCLGVIPYFKLKLEDEDGAMMEINKKVLAPIDVAVIMLPHMSNFTDFDALICEKDVSVRYITSKEEFGCPDLLIIPGSKNTIEDLHKIREYGLVDKIIEYGKTGLVIGICGGYQMLGLTIKDPYHVESDMEEIKGIGLLDVDTIFERDKKMTRVKLKCTNEHFDIDNDLYGYEIHMGRSIYKSNAKALFNILEENGEKVNYEDGAVNSSGNIFGTYVHGIFDGKGFRQFILNELRKSKGLALSNSPTYENEREKELDKLADLVRANINIEEIYKIMFNKES
jgi:adenosylcobyric acid synthase